MPTLAIVGAGPGLGLSIAKVFGGHGFDIALIARNKDKLTDLIDSLAAAGITAAAFPADTADREQLTGALDAAAERFGRIDVLEYSPHAGLVQVAPAEVTVDKLQHQIDEILYGAVAATQAVLAGMVEAGAGTLLYTLGGGALNPYPMLSTMNIAQAGLRNWVHNLHNTLADQGIYAADVAVNVMIADQAPAGVPHRSPDVLAQLYWEIHSGRDQVEYVVNP